MTPLDWALAFLLFSSHLFCFAFGYRLDYELLKRKGELKEAE